MRLLGIRIRYRQRIQPMPTPSARILRRLWSHRLQVAVILILGGHLWFVVLYLLAT